jgi:hypothetical protein
MESRVIASFRPLLLLSDEEFVGIVVFLPWGRVEALK